MPPTTHHTMMLTAACDEVVNATRAFHHHYNAGAGFEVLLKAEERQTAAIHCVNVLTRKMNEAAND